MAKDIYNALLEVQKAAPKVQKDAINPHFRSTYVTLNAALDAVLPLLTEQGVLLIQAPSNIEGQPALTTKLVHPESGSEVEYTALMPEDSNPQKLGSSITYFRRYALMSMLGLVGDEDDDANRASEPVRAPREVMRPTKVATAKPSF